jgi:hypothetical protein
LTFFLKSAKLAAHFRVAMLAFLKTSCEQRGFQRRRKPDQFRFLKNRLSWRLGTQRGTLATDVLASVLTPRVASLSRDLIDGTPKANQ